MEHSIDVLDSPSSSLPSSFILPEPAFSIIFYHSDHDTKLALSQTCSLFHACSSSYSIKNDARKAKYIVRRINEQIIQFSIAAAVLIALGATLCFSGIYAFFMFSQPAFAVIFLSSLSSFSLSSLSSLS